MDGAFDILGILAIRSEAANPRQEGDYIAQDGLLYCGECNTPKQCRPIEGDSKFIVHCMCACKSLELAKADEKAKRNERERRRIACFTSYDGGASADMQRTFSVDDSPESEPSRVARWYVENFNSRSDWLLLCGTNGIGKSFYSACICNALIDSEYICKFTSISEIASALWGAEDKAAVYGELSRYDLLVIDDFGSERSSDYMQEIQFNVFDHRLRSGRPCIITTNLSPIQICNPENQDLKRIFSRIYEKSIPLNCKGEDRRKRAMQKNASEKLRRILGG